MSPVETDQSPVALERLGGAPLAADAEHPGALGPAAEEDSGKRRGVLWVMGSFAICPCHLPLTLALAGTVLGGTAAGAALHRHVLMAGLIIAAVWGLGTLRGIKLLRSGGACALPQARRSRFAKATAVVRRHPRRQSR